MKIALYFPARGRNPSACSTPGRAARPWPAPLARGIARRCRKDLDTLIAQGPVERLNLTTNTQPVMLTSGVASTGHWLAAGGRQPDVVAGHSLGEYAALTAASALAAWRTPSASCASAPTPCRPPCRWARAPWPPCWGWTTMPSRAACAQAAQGEVVEAVNFNAPAQVVIAGHKAAVERACEAAKAAGAKRALLLPVSAPFHSSLLEPAAAVLSRALAEVGVSAPAIPVVNNVDVAMPTDPPPYATRWCVRPGIPCAGWKPCGRDEGAGRHPRRRMRSGQGPGRPDQAYRRRV